MFTKIKTQVVVLGSGPGGYSAAFRCSDLGLNVTIVEKYSSLGGVCLNVGCIPSKTLLHVAKLINEIKLSARYGINLNDLSIDLDKLRAWKDNVVKQLNLGLSKMSKARNIKIINGFAKFVDNHYLHVQGQSGVTEIFFNYAIIASGSSSINLPFIPYQDKRIWNSTDALSLQKIPKKLLIIGGGVIGLEMATIYHALGSEIDIIEMSNKIMPVIDNDIIDVFMKCIEKQFNLFMNTKIIKVQPKRDGIYVSMQNVQSLQQIKCYDNLLVVVGRAPNSKDLGIDSLGIKIDEHGFIVVNKQMCTNIANIFAIGDVVGTPMLAHKSAHEGHVVAEVISGKNRFFDARIIPSIVYSEPELAWVGITEKDAIKNGINYESAIFPWYALGRAVSSDYHKGITKLIFDKDTNKIIGGLLVGINSSELLGEIGLAIEMGCDAEDISMTIHAHPTLYESIGLAASIYVGSITDMLNVKK